MKLYTLNLLVLTALVTIFESAPCTLLSKDSEKITRIVKLAETSNLGDTDVEEFEKRIQEIRDIFVAAGDRRGIFASIYAVVTSGGLREVSKPDVFEDPQSMRRLIVAFSKTYLNSLKGYFSSDPEDQKLLKPQWKTYFEYAEDFTVHPLYVLTTGMNTHITLDLVDAIIQSKMRPRNNADFRKMGDNLIVNIDGVIEALVNDYEVNRAAASSLMKGFALKKWKKYDGRSQVGNAMMHYLRDEAWEDAAEMAPWVSDEKLSPPETIESPSHHWKDKAEWWTWQQIFKGSVYVAKDGWQWSETMCNSSPDSVGSEKESVASDPLEDQDPFDDLNK